MANVNPKVIQAAKWIPLAICIWVGVGSMMYPYWWYVFLFQGGWHTEQFVSGIEAVSIWAREAIFHEILLSPVNVVILAVVVIGVRTALKRGVLEPPTIGSITWKHQSAATVVLLIGLISALLSGRARSELLSSLLTSKDLRQQTRAEPERFSLDEVRDFAFIDAPRVQSHLAHKTEHVVDLATGAIVGVTVQDADEGDTTTSRETLIEAAEQIEAVLPDGEGVQEVVADKGYHSNHALIDLEAVGVRSYISEPDRGRRNWKKNPAARAVVYRNRRRIQGSRGRRLLRLRGERLERPFAHLYETGGMRRLFLRGHSNIRKRLLIHIGGFNLGLLMRQLVGVGTPRRLQGRLTFARNAVDVLIRALWSRVGLYWPSRPVLSLLLCVSMVRWDLPHVAATEPVFTTGC